MFYDPQDLGMEILIAFVICAFAALIVIALLSGEVFPSENDKEEG